jgi:hypothetical protein
MVPFSWIEKEMSFLTACMGVYRLNAGDDFFFEPTPGFYGFISQGTVNSLNEGIRILSDHIRSRTTPVIEEWEGSPDPLVSADYDWTKDKTPPGMIRYKGPNHSRIEINITNKHSPYIMGAILAHELTHHFLDSKGIRHSDIEKNEKLTDLATAYIGLGKLTINGYEPISWTQKRAQGTVNYTYQIGYLSPDDMAAIIHQVCVLRSISLEVAKRNLSEKALTLFDGLGDQANEYLLKKQLVGERQCPRCKNFAIFSFGEDEDDVYCSECGWEWNACLRYAYKKRNKLWQRLRRWIKS